ncbi:MAG: glycosyltransferase [Planctomycetota bacterium]|nr:glycosyltransferase [Planctomycetota bacterium]
MRILHLLAFIRADIGGPARAVTDLCAALAARGHEVTLVTWDDSDVPASWRAPQAASPPTPRVVTIPGPTAPGQFFKGPTLQHLTDLIRTHDAFHVHGVWNPWNWQLSAIARRLNVPYFVSVRGMLDDWCMTQGALKKKLFLLLAVRRWLERAAAVHLTAQFELEQARKHFPAGKGIVVPNLLDLTPFQTLPGPDRARARFPQLAGPSPTLLFLSRIHVKKGLEPLLRAVRLLADRGRPVNLIIAGSGEPAYVDSVKRLAAELGIQDRAAFVGQVVDQDKLSLYEAADLFVLPTSQENFGFVFVEALACRTPVVTTRGVDIWPELEASGGAVIAPADETPLADTLSTLLDRPDRLDQMGHNGRQWVFQSLDPGNVIQQFERMYRQER